MENAEVYMLITALSFPFLAMYNAGAALFRASGNSRLPMTVSILSNIINIIGNAILIFGLKMGVLGAAIPTLLGRVFCAVVILYKLRQPHQKIIVHDYRAIRPDFKRIGQTRDDAAGEAFDKAARVLGLPYPGGLMMDRLATAGRKDAFPFTAATVHDSEYDFSFSGLKTAVINCVHTRELRGQPLDEETKADIAASFTDALVRTIVTRVSRLLERSDVPALVLAGGVAANSHLRAALTELCGRLGRPLYLPPLSLCGDNAAMIAAQGYYEYRAGNLAPLSQNAYATAGV